MGLFGTDGARGVANTELTCDVAFKLGQAAVTFLGTTVVVGRDTRLSGDMLEAAVVAGITSMGGTALLAGIIPTPGVALLVRNLKCEGGVVISASHNPPEYNGIKLFDGQGYKLSEDLEAEIEAFVEQGGASTDELPAGDAVGVSVPVENACEIYIDHAVKSVSQQGVDFKGMKIALDVGFGAAALTSKEALTRLGAEVHVINEDFDGLNINVKCGSTYLEPLRDLVNEIGADIGIAHDGDADRVMMIGAEGREIDGDIIEAVCAVSLKERGLLVNDTAVSTVMCNLGFVKAMNAAGIEVVQTQVGDRYVLEYMREHDLTIGGEQSGHMIFLEHNSTGDGLVTACQFLVACRLQGKTPDEAAAVMQHFPQTLINVKATNKEALKSNVAVKEAIAQAEAALGDSGRILVRPSGTEPLIRVMVEAEDATTAKTTAENVAKVIETELT